MMNQYFELKKMLLEMCPDCPKDYYGKDPSPIMDKYYEQIWKPVHEKWVEYNSMSKIDPKTQRLKEKNDNVHGILSEVLLVCNELLYRHNHLKRKVDEIMANLEEEAKYGEMPIPILSVIDELHTTLHRGVFAEADDNNEKAE